MNVQIQKRPRKGRNQWSYRVTMVLGARDEGGPARHPLGTVHHYRGDGGALAIKEAALADWQAGTYAGACKLTVKQLIERWFRDGPVRRRTTLAGYRDNAERHIYEVELDRGEILGDLIAAKVTSAQWASWQAGQLAYGRKGRNAGESLSPKSVRDYRAVAYGAYEWAVDVRLLRVNPLSRVKTPPLPKRPYEVPDLATMGAYIEEVRGTRYWMPLVLGAAAMRRGEVLGLRWCDVNFANGKTRICRQVLQIGNEAFVGPLKTDSGYREITLPSFVMEEVRAHKRAVAAELLAAGKSWDDEAPICGVIKPKRLSSGLRQLFVKRHLPPVNMHKLRHAVATDMIRRGINPQAVQQLLGHADVNTTLTIYSHVNDDDVAAACEEYGRAWDEAQRTRSSNQLRRKYTKGAEVVGLDGRPVEQTPAKERPTT